MLLLLPDMPVHRALEFKESIQRLGKKEETLFYNDTKVYLSKVKFRTYNFEFKRIFDLYSVANISLLIIV